MAEKCPRCHGGGKVVEDGEPVECPECQGTGEVEAKETEKD